MVCAPLSNPPRCKPVIRHSKIDLSAARVFWTLYLEIDKTSRSQSQFRRRTNARRVIQSAPTDSIEQSGRKMGIFQSGRGHLHYEDIGSGRPILLIHGFTNYGLSWVPQLAALVHSGYRVILPDLRGHGASSPATALCTVSDLAADMIDLLNHLDAGSVTLCGLSLGGMVALQMALDQPDRVAGIIVANSRSSFTGPEMTAMVNAWVALFLQEDGPLKRLHATWPTLVKEEFRESAPGRAAFDAWARVLATVQGLSLCHVAQGMTQFDLRGRLAAIRTPALVISGEHDRLFSPDQSREISGQIAGSRCSVIPGAGHLSSLDSPDQFNRLLLDFLASHFPVV
jgi:3-oxoadipate enol-lactonase